MVRGAFRNVADRRPSEQHRDEVNVEHGRGAAAPFVGRHVARLPLNALFGCRRGCCCCGCFRIVIRSHRRRLEEEEGNEDGDELSVQQARHVKCLTALCCVCCASHPYPRHHTPHLHHHNYHVVEVSSAALSSSSSSLTTSKCRSLSSTSR